MYSIMVHKHQEVYEGFNPEIADRTKPVRAIIRRRRIVLPTILLISSILVVFIPVNNLRTMISVDNKTPSILLPNDLRGIEFPAVRQQLHEISLSFNNLCELWSFRSEESRILVSTSVGAGDGRSLSIIKNEGKLSIFLGETTVFARLASSVFINNCDLQIKINGSKLSLVATKLVESVLLPHVPKFSILVVDEDLFDSGHFTATMTTESYGTQLTPLAALVRFLCLSFLFFLVMQFSNLFPFDKAVNA